MFDKPKTKRKKEEEAEAEASEQNEPPPPSYSTTTSNIAGESSTSTTPYLPQQYHTQAPAHTLKTTYTNWLRTKIEITDASEENSNSGANPTAPPLYTASNHFLHLLSTHTTFYKSSNPSPSVPASGSEPPPTALAQVRIHYVTAKIDITLSPNNPSPIIFKVPKLKFKKADVTYASPTLRGETLTWKVKTYDEIMYLETLFGKVKTHAVAVDLECTDAGGVALARVFSSIRGAEMLFFGGKVGGGGGSEGLLDELVVVGVALAQHYVAVRD